ncbi:MAG: poly-gamma-glutamate hydrolase family protein [Geminicoccaceae bacterium]
MSTYDCNVRRAFASQDTLIDREEHCSADPEQLAAIGRAQGQQLRVRRSDDDVALYTVSEVRPETPATIVRMARVARARLTPATSEIPDEFAAIVEAQVPHPTYTDEEAETHSEFVERLTDDGVHVGLVAIAPHGGAIEEWTDQQAERVASQLAAKGVSSWRCKGWRQDGGAFRQWHVTSSEIHEASFPLLNSIIHRSFTYAVAFHGFSENRILIGGGACDALKQEIRTAIRCAIAGSDIVVDIATEADNFGGDNPNNIVNRLADGNGIQIEQSKVARDVYWQQIADRIAEVYNCKIAC